jgi:hypothetical protein
MIVYSLLLITLLLAFVSLWLVWKGRPSGKFLGIVLAGFVYLYGTWLYVSVYGRYVFGALALGLLAASLLRRRAHRDDRKSIAVGHASVSILLLALIVLYFTGTRNPSKAVELQFPLHRGKYLVFQGGRGMPTNLFHSFSGNGALSFDLVRLYPSGNRARGIFSKRLSDYAIFGDTVFAPCAGRVGRVRSDNPDNIPPERKRGPSNLNGFVIETDGFHVFLGHFSQGGVFVQEGDVVEPGDPLGLVGNSGWSIEPHLHIQAHVNSGPGQPWWSEEPVLIHFDGEEYRLFEVITPKEVPMKL